VSAPVAPWWSPLRWVEAGHRARFRRWGFEERTAVLPGARIRYRVAGTGRPLVLVHGFGADGAWCWQYQAALAASRRVLIPDLLWFGGSDATAVPTLRAQVDALGALLDHEGVPRADVAGISYGGFVALALAVRRPERVSRLVLVASPGPTWTAEDSAAMRARFRVQSSADIVCPTDASGVRRLLELAWTRPPPVPAFVLRQVHAAMFQDRMAQKRALIDELESHADAAPNWQVDAPTLLLWGENDPLFPVPSAHRLAAAIGAHARVEVMAGTRHAPNLERPAEFNDRLARFLGA
jgi:pimeloyl-ACP methyl ester carboxylesterase